MITLGVGGLRSGQRRSLVLNAAVAHTFIRGGLQERYLTLSAT